MTPILYRCWASGRVIGILPEVPGDAHGALCLTLDYGARRGAAVYLDLLSAPRPASELERAPVHETLTRQYPGLALEDRTDSMYAKDKDKGPPAWHEARHVAAREGPNRVTEE